MHPCVAKMGVKRTGEVVWRRTVVKRAEDGGAYPCGSKIRSLAEQEWRRCKGRCRKWYCIASLFHFLLAKAKRVEFTWHGKIIFFTIFYYP